jgi:hypothetical protein
MTDGRIQLDLTKKYPAYERVTETKRSIEPIESTMLKSQITSTPVSQLFFSRQNINALQLGMKNMVYAKSCKKYVIGNQSEDELLTIMRAVYFQNAKHLPYSIVEQVRDLNGSVLVYAVPRIINEIEMHQTYLKDITNAPKFYQHGQATSVKGNKQLEMRSFV